MIDAAGMEFRLPLRVYIEDTDAGGIVYHANYLKFMERARTEGIRQLGFGKAALGGDGTAIFVVTDAQLKFRRPAQLDDQLVATAALVNLGKASLVFEQNIWRGEELLCQGEIKVACVHHETRRATRIPAALYQMLTQQK